MLDNLLAITRCFPERSILFDSLDFIIRINGSMVKDVNSMSCLLSILVQSLKPFL